MLVPGFILYEGKAGENTFYQFVATPTQLLRIAYVHHRRASSTSADLDGISKTYQRMLKPRKVKEIGEFIDQRHYFPNSIIISFNTPPTFEFTEYQKSLPFRAGTLTFPNEYGSAWIIDGQHRLYGFARSTRGMNDPIPVVAFKNLSLSEQSRLFVEINKNQTNVGTNLLWDLYGDIYQGSEDKSQREDLILSNIVKRLDAIKNSPFNGHIYIPSHGNKSSNRNLTMVTMCQNIKRNKILARDLLGRQVLEQEDFEEFAAERIAAFFRSVRMLFSEDWVKGEKGYLRTNNGIAAFIVLLKRTLSYLNNEEKSHVYVKGNTRDFEDEVYLLLLPAIEYLRLDPKRSSEFRKRSGQAGQMASADELSRIIKTEYSGFYAPSGESASEESSIENQTQAQAKELDELIKDTELQLRKFIKQDLQECFGNAWYKKGVPGGVKGDIEKRINQEIQNYPYKETALRKSNEGRLEFTYLGHLKDIIVYGANWPRFKEIFKSKQNLEVYFKNYNALRNAYRGHMREVDPVLMDTGRAAIRWIRQCLNM